MDCTWLAGKRTSKVFIKRVKIEVYLDSEFDVFLYEMFCFKLTICIHDMADYLLSSRFEDVHVINGYHNNVAKSTFLG